jgi:hypothetical protein
MASPIRPDGRDPIAIRRALQQINRDTTTTTAYGLTYSGSTSIGAKIDELEASISSSGGGTSSGWALYLALIGAGGI